MRDEEAEAYASTARSEGGGRNLPWADAGAESRTAAVGMPVLHPSDEDLSPGIPVLDRLIQQAHNEILQPLFDPGFSSSSYGFRPGRNAHQAVEAARRYVESGKRWVVDLDLEKFFDRVNHDVLMARVARKVGDERVLKRIMQAVTAFLEDVLKLKINVSKSAVARPWERKFLGYSMTWHKKPKLKIAGASRKRMAEKIRETLRKARGQSLQRAIERINPILRGWLRTSGSPKSKVCWKTSMAGSGASCGPFCGGSGSASMRGQRT
jgi:hypothetical protein